ncbi:MAG: hypothetical protein IPH77_01735 [Ignavibacteria bacterium]|nr:hypothetical protein [Ignavibacteria bacterium]
MTPTLFAKQSAFRNWLEKNHKKEAELLVGFIRLMIIHVSSHVGDLAALGTPTWAGNYLDFRPYLRTSQSS